MVIFLPLILYGVGVCLGVASKRLWKRKLRIWALSLGGVSIVTPLILNGILIHKIKIQRQERALALKTYQNLTLKDQLGDQKVLIPISPQFELFYKCYGEKSLEGDAYIESAQKCHMRKNLDDIRSLSIEARPEYSQDLSDINIYMIAEDCASKLSKQCVSRRAVQQWCAGRDSLKQSLFCTGSPKHRIHFKRYLGRSPNSAFVERLYQKEWPDSGLQAVGDDFMGQPVLVRCSKTRDERVAKDKRAAEDETDAKDKTVPKYGGNRLCHLKFLISKDVIARVTLDGFAPEDLKQDADEMFGYTHDMWQALRRE